MSKINILQVNEVDFLGKMFNGYDFINKISDNQFEVKQAVIIKESNNPNVVEILKTEKEKQIFFRLQALERELSIHNLLSITTPALENLDEFIKKPDTILADNRVRKS